MENVEFQKLISDFLAKNYSFNKRLLANKFGVSLPTIQRWAEGKTSPHPIMREHVIKYLKRRMSTGP